MKKLIMVVALVAGAIAANAASINWKVNMNGASLKGGAEMPSGYDIYLVLGSSAAGVISALEAGTFTASTAGVLDKGTTNNTKGRMTVERVVTSSSLTLDGSGNGVLTDFNLLVVDTTSVPGETWYKMSAAMTVATYNEGADVPVPTTVGFTSTSWANGTSWTQSVPEPTSGLLLLLGVAGLALKRKRA